MTEPIFLFAEKIEAIDGFQTAIVVENDGEEEALHACEIFNVVTVGIDDWATPEENSAFDEDFKNVDRIILALANDSVGAYLTEEVARRLGKERCYRVHWPEGCYDSRTTIFDHGQETLRQCVADAEPYPIDGVYAPNAQDLVQLRRRPLDRGVSTGWANVDEFYRVRPGTLSVVTGIPGMGKSEWLDALMMNIAKTDDWKFVICSLEHDPEDHAGKLLEKYVSKPFRDFGFGTMTDDEIVTHTPWIEEHFKFLANDTEDGATLDWILEQARLLISRHGSRGLVIDPWGDLEHRRPPAQTETEYTGETLARLRRFARRNGIAIWLVAHPKKMERLHQTGEIPVPSLYDISGSAHWANKPDAGIVVHRADISATITDIHVRKIKLKHLGKPGAATLDWSKKTGIYTPNWGENYG